MRSEVNGALLTFSYGSFLLTYPNFGPISIKIVEALNANPYEFFSCFYLSHVLGIAFSSIFLDRVEKRIRLLKVTIPVLISSAFLTIFNHLAIFAIGFTMGVFIVILGSYFARFIKPWRRGKTFAFGAFMSNVYLFLLTKLTFLNLPVLVLLSILPLLLVFTIPNENFELRSSKINGKFVYFSLPVFVFYFVGGVMYGIMEKAFREAGISTHVLFYATLVILAGIVYDKVDRKIVAIAGLIALSASLLLFPSSLVYSAHLIQSSYAFVDVFAMMIWADISRVGSEAKQYGIGMLSITLPIYLGFLLSESFSFQLSTTIMIVLLVLSAFLLGSVEEPATTPEEYLRWLARR
ncbi:hypothetical protein Ferp_0867 [Ferroglobus placidus DSM 10642]|uniref:Major facilitator superfamily MFS_1 n=1 Tax=Ferroglobus placidus (strain DSM 10642 / AEDII12DO) TaxID=589924 RepID=D3RX22_FERPA|nr:hypothetical protein [Ferroglobus placidus]ADC65035.1 hypothetical protein Ferp_0867 [Ferroglobus placidus DSM 10642]